MNMIEAKPQAKHILQEIDRLITEMTTLRSQVAELIAPPVQQTHSVREADYFGMWAEREDMRNLSSREWLERQRAQQWNPR